MEQFEKGKKYNALTITGQYFIVRGLALIPVQCDCGKNLDIRPCDLGKLANCGCGTDPAAQPEPAEKPKIATSKTVRSKVAKPKVAKEE